MVSVEKVKRGLAAFFDNELMPMLPSTGWENIVVGTAIGVLLKRLEKIIAGLQQNGLALAAAVVDDQGNVDIEIIRDELKAQIQKKGSLQIDNLPVIKKITFRAEDVDKAFEYIMKG